MTVDPAAPAPGIRKAAARGARIMMLGQAARVLLQVVAVVVLARLLSIEDYAHFALVMAVVSLGEAFRDFGLSSAAIQSKTITQGQRSNLLWINVGLGGALALLCFVCAPLIGDLLDDPVVADLARVLALSFLLNGAIVQYRADLNRNLRFSALVISDVGGMLVGLVAGVVSALQGLGYWSLAVQQLSGLVASLMLAVFLGGWLPKAPSRSADVRPFLGFGAGMLGTQLVGYFNNNIDTLTIGMRLNTADVGIYNRAYQLLMQTLNQFRNPSLTVALPILSKLEPGHPQADEAILRGQRALGYSLVAGCALAAGAAEPVIHLALGPGWEAAAPLFAILAVAGAFQTVGFVSAWVFVARGLTTRMFGYSLISVSIRIVCVVTGSFYGVVGVAVGFAVAPMIGLPLSYYLLGRWTPLPRRSLYAGAGRIITCFAIAAGTTWAVDNAAETLPDVVRLLLCMATTVAVYAALTLVPAIRRDIHEVVVFGRMALGRGGGR